MIYRRLQEPLEYQRVRPAVHSALEILAVHYGMLDQRGLDAIRQEGAYSRAIRDFMEFLKVIGPKEEVGKAMALAQKRFAKFA